MIFFYVDIRNLSETDIFQFHTLKYPVCVSNHLTKIFKLEFAVKTLMSCNWAHKS